MLGDNTSDGWLREVAGDAGDAGGVRRLRLLGDRASDGWLRRVAAGDAGEVGGVRRLRLLGDAGGDEDEERFCLRVNMSWSCGCVFSVWWLITT